MMYNLNMKKFSWILLIALAMPAAADEAIANKIISAVKIQGTVVGKNITPSAIVDDLIVHEGEVFSIDSETGHLMSRLFPKEIDDHPSDQKVKVISIAHGNVVFEYEGTNISLVVGPRSW